MAGSRITLRQGLVGLVAVAVIAACAFHLRRGWTRAHTRQFPPMPGAAEQLRRGLTRRGPRSDTGTVQEWRIAARPLLLPADAPALLPGLDTEMDISLLVAPGKPLRVSELRPAIAIEVDLVLSATEREPPALWPGMAAVRLLRGDTPQGPFTQIREISRADTEAVWPRVGLMLGTSMTIASYHFSLLDPTPGLGKLHGYTVQMVDPAGAVLAESGVCTGRAFAPPTARLREDSKGHLMLSWPALDLSTDAFAEPPRLTLGVSGPTQPLRFDTGTGWFYELGRFPLAPGEFTLPFPLGAAGSLSTVAQFGLVGQIRRQEWAKSHGTYESVAAIGLGGVVTERPGRLPSVKVGLEQRRLVLIPQGEGAIGYQPGSLPAAFSLHYEVAAPLRPTAMTIRHGRTGAVETIAPVPASAYPQPVGVGERLFYTLSVSAGQNEITLTASCTSPPMPAGLRASSEPAAIRLTWDPVPLDPGDWAEEAQFVIRRVPVTEVLAGGSKALRWPGVFSEAGRVPANATEFTDRNVLPGDEYFYTLDLEGVVRGTAWVSDAGEIAVNIPVRCGTVSQGGPEPLLARAEASGPVRVAVDPFLGTAVQSAAAREALEAGLRREEWVRLVDRANVAPLLDETHLAAFAKPAGTAATPEPQGTVQAADAIVRCTRSTTPQGGQIEITLIEVRRLQSEMLGTWPESATVWDEVLPALLARLKTQFPDWEQRAGNSAAAPGPAARLTVAVLDPDPLVAECDETLPAGTLQALLTAALTETGGWDTVDRERLAAVLAEQGLAGMTTGPKPLELGRLVNADALVTGTYRLQQGKVSLTGHLVSVATGQYLATVAVEGSKDDLATLTRQFAVKAVAARPEPAAAAAGSAAQRAMEAQAGTAGHDRLAAAKTAAFVGPANAETLAKLGQEYDHRGQLEEALNCYLQALDLDEKSGRGTGMSSAAWCRPQADEVLRKLRRPQDRVLLWQRAIARRGPGQRDNGAVIRLAEALCDAGKKEEAQATLQRAGVTLDDPNLVALLDKLGDAATAGDALLHADWFRGSGFSSLDRSALGPAYARVIRALDAAPAEQRPRLLAAIVVGLGAARPVQTLRAAAELRQAGPLPTETLHVTLDAALTVGAAEVATALVQDLQTREPADLAVLKELGATVDVLQRHGRQEEGAALTKRALGLPLKGEAAERLRTLLQRRLKTPAKGDPEAAKAMEPGIDDDLWKHVAGRGGRITGPNSDVYVLTETGFLLRLVEAERRVVWQYSLGFRKPFPRPEPDRGYALKIAENGFWLMADTVYACNFGDGVVHAVDTATGRPRWTHTEWTAVSAPLVRPQHDACVCTANSFGELVILAAKDGQLIKRVPAPAELSGRYNAELPDISVIHDNARDEPVHWTDWIQVSLGSSGSFSRRNYWSQRGDANGLVYIDANREGSYAYHMVSGETKITDLATQYEGNPATWEAALADRTSTDRGQVVHEARRAGDPQKTLPTLLKILRDPDEDTDLRQRAIGLILDLGREEGLNAVVEALTDPAFRVRMEAQRALYNYSPSGGTIPPATLGRVAQIAHEPAKEPASAAVACLIRLGGVGVKPLIQDILDGPASSVRERAVMALGEAGDAAMVPLLLPLLRDGVPLEQQQNLVQTLSALGEPKARALYLGTINTAEWLAKAAEATQRDPTSQEILKVEMLVVGIAKYAPDESLVPFLEELSKSYGDRLTARICRALGSIGAARSVPFLIALLPLPGAPRGRGGVPDPTPSVVSALKQITGADLDDRPADWQKWWDTHRAELENRGKAAPPR